MPGNKMNSNYAVLRSMSAARGLDISISFDCNFRARLWGARAAEAPPVLGGLCEQADLIFGDERDIAFMLGFKAEESDSWQRRRRAADAAFAAFSRLQYIACTDRARHSVEVQQLTGCLQSKSDVWTSRAYPLASSIGSAQATHSPPAFCMDSSVDLPHRRWLISGRRRPA